MKKLPILESNGRTILGYASSIAGAKRFLTKRCLGDSSKSLIKNYGFDLNVWVRDPMMTELNGGHHGFMFSIGKNLGNH